MKVRISMENICVMEAVSYRRNWGCDVSTMTSFSLTGVPCVSQCSASVAGILGDGVPMGRLWQGPPMLSSFCQHTQAVSCCSGALWRGPHECPHHSGPSSNVLHDLQLFLHCCHAGEFIHCCLAG